MFRVDAEKFTGAAGPLNGAKLFLQPPKFSPGVKRRRHFEKKKKDRKKATRYKNAKHSKLTLNVPKV